MGAAESTKGGRVCGPVMAAGQSFLRKHQPKGQNGEGMHDNDPFYSLNKAESTEDYLNVVPKREMLDAEELMKRTSIVGARREDQEEEEEASDGGWLDDNDNDGEHARDGAGVADEATETPNLCDRIRQGRIDDIKHLLQQRPELVRELDTRGYSPLYLACGLGSVDMVHILLEARADVEQLSAKGVSALRLVACKGRVTIVDRLLEAKANIDSTALLGAAFHGQDSVISSFVEAHRMDGHALPLESRTRKGDTALMVAADRGHVGVVRVLLEAAADPNARNRQGYTALMKAASHGDAESCAALLRGQCSTLPTNVFDHDALKVAQLAHHDFLAGMLSENRSRHVADARLCVLLELHAGKHSKDRTGVHHGTHMAAPPSIDSKLEDQPDVHGAGVTQTSQACSSWFLLGQSARVGPQRLKGAPYVSPESLRAVIDICFDFVGK